jgi:hypothetical protein
MRKMKAQRRPHLVICLLGTSCRAPQPGQLGQAQPRLSTVTMDARLPRAVRLLCCAALCGSVPVRGGGPAAAASEDGGRAEVAPSVPPPCSLNGAGSPCICDPGWTGKNCGQLDLLPAPPLASQVTALSATTTNNTAANSTWGISVVGPDKVGVYHGYMTEIANHCPLGDYSSASQIVHLTAPHPLGPWTRKGVALAGFAHNPQAVMSPNGSILLFHIGKELAPGCLKNCNTNLTSAAPSPSPAPQCARMSHATSVAVADSYDGPWTRFPYILGDRPTNPAPFICKSVG